MTGTWGPEGEEEGIGDFEDLEEMEEGDTPAETEEPEEGTLAEGTLAEGTPEEEKTKYQKKKERLKAMFDTDYDENGDESKYLSDLKDEADAQTKMNKDFFVDELNRER